MNDVTENLPAAPPDHLPTSKELMAQVPGIFESPDLTLSDQSMNFKEMWQFAQIISKADCAPKQWKGKPNDCFLAVGLSIQLRVNPLVFMQHCYPVYGKIRAEGKFVKALIDTNGPYSDGLHVEGPTGTGESRRCTAWGTRRSNGERDELAFSMRDAGAAGWLRPKPDDNRNETNWWLKLPDQMLVYRTVSLFCDRYCPNVRMGLETMEEAHDIGDGVTVLRPARASSELNQTLESVRGKAAAAESQTDTPKDSAPARPANVEEAGTPAGSASAGGGRVSETPELLRLLLDEAGRHKVTEAMLAARMKRPVSEFDDKNIETLLDLFEFVRNGQVEIGKEFPELRAAA
jgi:hypothetical protein